MKVALIRPRVKGGDPEFYEPLAMFSLSAALKNAGHEPRVFDRRLFDLLGRDFFAELSSFGADSLAFGLMTSDDAPDALRILQTARDQSPHIPVIIGGLFPTTDPERARALFPSGTVVVRGEGERAIVALAEGGDIGALRAQSPGEWPVPDHQDLREYLGFGCPIGMRSARGCDGVCAFCATPNLPEPYCRWESRPIHAVADEMAVLAARAEAIAFPPVFNFVEDDFGPLERVEMLGYELLRRGVRAAFSLQLRGTSLCGASSLPERAAALKRAGLCRVFLGIESVDAESLRAWRKPMDPDAVFSAVETLRSAGIAVHTGYILWHPRSSVEGAKREMRRLHAHGCFSPKAALSRLVAFPGCDIHREKPREGVYWPDLSPECEAYFALLSDVLAPLFAEWVKGATALPRLCCLRHFDPADERSARVDELLAGINDFSLGIALNPENRSSAEVEAYALRVGRELDAFCGSGLRS